MSVIFKAREQTFKASEILWAKRELIDAIVEQALLSQTEAFVDMIVDGQEDLSRGAVQETLKGVKESAAEFLNDMIGDLKHEVERRIEAARYGASVTGIKYDLAGEVTDVEIDVTVSFAD
jgi:hypothetical protein